MIHRQHLTAKCLRHPPQGSLDVAVKAINKGKANARIVGCFGSFAKKPMNNLIVFSFTLRLVGYQKASLLHGTANFTTVWSNFSEKNLLLLKMFFHAGEISVIWRIFTRKLTVEDINFKIKKVTLIPCKTIICNLINKVELY